MQGRSLSLAAVNKASTRHIALDLGCPRLDFLAAVERGGLGREAVRAGAHLPVVRAVMVDACHLRRSGEPAQSSLAEIWRKISRKSSVAVGIMPRKP